MPLDGYGASVGRASPLVNPLAQLGGLLIEMWDAERSDLITIATGVSAWAGIKAGLTITQGTGAAQPAWSATSFAGAAGVAFDGLDDSLGLTLAGQLPAAADPCEIWALVSQDALDSDTAVSRVAVNYGATTGVDSRGMQRLFNTSFSRARGFSGTGAAAGNYNAVFFNFNSRHVLRWCVEPTRSTLYVNGIIAGSVAVVPGTVATRLRLGGSAAAAASNHWQGQIAAAAFTLPLPPSLAAGFTNYLLRRRRV